MSEAFNTGTLTLFQQVLGHDFLPHVYTSYWLSGRANRAGIGKPDPAKRRRIDFKVPTDGSFMTFPSK